MDLLIYLKEKNGMLHYRQIIMLFLQNALALGQKILQTGKGFNILRELIYSANEQVIYNTLHLLNPFSHHQQIVSYIKP